MQRYTDMCVRYYKLIGELVCDWYVIGQSPARGKIYCCIVVANNYKYLKIE